MEGPSSAPVVSVDVDPDRAAAAVAAAWHLPDGRIGTDLALYRSGDLTDLTAAVLATLADLKPSVVGFDPWTTEGLAEAVTAAGYVVQPVTGRAWVAACQTLYELLTTSRLAHPGREALTIQLGHAGRRQSAEGRWWITRAGEPIPAVTATARAVYLASRPRPVYQVF
jgi:hypothetical protein